MKLPKLNFQISPAVRLLLVLFTFSTLLLSCSDDDDDVEQNPDLVGVAQSRSELSNLVAALERAELTTFLMGQNADYTVFAPNNTAFSAFLQANGFASLEEVPDAVLEEILTYHLLQGRQLSGSLQTQSYTTLSGESIEVSTANGVTINGSSMVVTADLEASNGVIHIIDEVLTPTPPATTITSLAIADPELSTLVEVLSLPELSDLLDAASSTSSDLTVFAPTNAAFSATLTALGKTSIDELPVDVLRNIVSYHILPTSVAAAELTAGTYASLQGENITVTTDGGVMINGQMVSTADIMADNGIIHKIDGVLLPAEPTAVLGTTLGIAYFNPDFTTLVAAVKKAELVETLLNADATTIFAPTNDAFTAAGITSLDNLSKEDLTPILTYHVLGEMVMAADLQMNHTTLQGEDLYPRRADDAVYINGKAMVAIADLSADNGVVHAIDMVLLPPTESIAGIVTQMATDENSPEFTLLLAAVQHAGLATTLTSGGPFTVFAPTDAAFAAAGFATAEDINNAEAGVIESILLYHVVAGNIFSVELSSGSVTTAQGQDITIDAEALTITDASDGVANLSADNLNVLATNGVIHVIDKVLIPAN